jgi:pilus assembly protein Flp/PilA
MVQARSPQGFTRAALPRFKYGLDLESNGTRLRTARRLLADDRAQGLVEYALIIALVSIVAIAALRFLGNKANNTLRSAANSLS